MKTEEKLASGSGSDLPNNDLTPITATAVVAPSDGEPALQAGLTELQRQFPGMIRGHQTLNAQTAVTILQKARERNPTTTDNEVLQFVRDRVVLHGRHWDTWGGVVHMVHNDYPGVSRHSPGDPGLDLAGPPDGDRLRPPEHFSFKSDSGSPVNISEEGPDHLARAQAILKNLDASTFYRANHGSVMKKSMPMARRS